jgi:hypothetical protein
MVMIWPSIRRSAQLKIWIYSYVTSRENTIPALVNLSTTVCSLDFSWFKMKDVKEMLVGRERDEWWLAKQLQDQSLSAHGFDPGFDSRFAASSSTRFTASSFHRTSSERQSNECL